jgi:hypothetical protein
VTVSVHVFPDTLEMLAVNCLTAAPALLACGARTSAPVRSRIEAENESRPRHERPNFDKAIAGPPFSGRGRTHPPSYGYLISPAIVGPSTPRGTLLSLISRI